MSAIHADSLITALWLAWLLYWKIAARDVKATRRKESVVSRAVFAIPLVGAVALFFVPGLWTGWLAEPFLPRGWTGYWAGVAVVAAGLGFSVWARIHLGRNWSGTVTLKEDHQLIRSGPYRFVRHPIYTGMLAGFAGTAIALDQWRGLVALALIVFAFLRKLGIEERWMTEAFPDQYPRYRAEVAGLIPFVF